MSEQDIVEVGRHLELVHRVQTSLGEVWRGSFNTLLCRYNGASCNHKQTHFHDYAKIYFLFSPFEFKILSGKI